MGHDHSHKGSQKNILIAFALNAIFSIIELIGGYLTNSVAIMSDALHDFGDSLALLFSYFAEKLSKREADSKFNFGYRRFSILAALVNGLVLFSGSIYVIYEAVSRIQSPEEVKPEGMIYLAVLGIAVNSVAAWRLSKDEGVNVRMIMLHLLEDLYGWIAVLVVSIILLFKPWYVLDSVLSILISALILKGVFKNLKKVGLIILQQFPEELELEKLLEGINTLKNVVNVHEIKGWSLDSEHHYLRIHISVPENTTIEDLDILKVQAKEILKGENIVYSTIEFESVKSNCSN